MTKNAGDDADRERREADVKAWVASLPSPIKDRRDCTHEVNAAFVGVVRIMDAARFMAEIQIRCVQCGQPFVFVGVPAGVDFGRPTCSIDGTELIAPIEPEVEKALHTAARFVVPPVPVRH